MDVTLRTTLREKAREQLDTKVAELEEVQSRLELREVELFTMHDTQAMVPAELEQLHRQTANRSYRFVEVQSPVKS